MQYQQKSGKQKNVGTQNTGKKGKVRNNYTVLVIETAWTRPLPCWEFSGSTYFIIGAGRVNSCGESDIYVHTYSPSRYYAEYIWLTVQDCM